MISDDWVNEQATIFHDFDENPLRNGSKVLI